MTPEEKKLIKARKLVAAVNRLAKKQGLNFFIVTDGASGISNNGNPAVRNAREAQIKWELEHGADPYEDWSKKAPKSISFPEDEIESLKNRDSIITHRISAERGKYSKGDEVVVPWGDKYVVSDRADLASVEDSPYKEYLTPEQKKELMKKKIALLTLRKKAQAVDHDKWPAFSDYQKKHHDDIVRAVRKIVRDDYMRRGNWGLKLDNGKLVGGEKVISDNDIVDKAVIRAGLEARRARRANCHEIAASILDKLLENGVVARRLLVDKDQYNGIPMGHSTVMFQGEDGRWHRASGGMADGKKSRLGDFDSLEDAIDQYIAVEKANKQTTDDERVDVYDTTDIPFTDRMSWPEYLAAAKKGKRMYHQEKKAQAITPEEIEALARPHYPDSGSHGWNHILDVIESAKRMRRKKLLKKELAALMYHDSSLLTGPRDTHAEDSAEIARKELAGRFSKRQIEDIANAIAHHRASYEGNRKSRLENLVAAADRDVFVDGNIDDYILRSYRYGLEHGMTPEEAVDNTLHHMPDKYGTNGYAYANVPKIYMDTYGDEVRKAQKAFDSMTADRIRELAKKASYKKKETYSSGSGTVESFTPDKTDGHDEIVLRLKNGKRIVISNNTKLGIRVIPAEGDELGYHGYQIDGTNVVHKVHGNRHQRGGWLEPEKRSTRLYTYLPKENTVDTAGILATALTEDGWKKYQGRTKMKNKDAVLRILDAMEPDWKRSMSISALEQPIPEDAAEDLVQFAKDSRLYSFDLNDLIKARLVKHIRETNDKKGTHEVYGVKKHDIDWNRKPGKLLFSGIPHYMIETEGGKIPYEFVRLEQYED